MLDLAFTITADGSQAKAEMRAVDAEKQKLESSLQRSTSWWQKEEQAIDEATGMLTTHRGEMSKVEQAAQKLESQVAATAVTTGQLGTISEEATAALGGLGGGAGSTATALLEMVGASELSIGSLMGLTGAIGAALGLAGLFGSFLVSSVDYYVQHAKAAAGLRTELEQVGQTWSALQLMVGATIMDGESAPLIGFLKLAQQWALSFGIELTTDLAILRKIISESTSLPLVNAFGIAIDPGAIPDPSKVLGGKHPLGSYFGPGTTGMNQGYFYPGNPLSGVDPWNPAPAAAAQAEFDRQEAERKRRLLEAQRQAEKLRKERERLQELIDNGVPYHWGLGGTLPGERVPTLTSPYSGLPSLPVHVGLTQLPGQPISRFTLPDPVGPSLLDRIFGSVGKGLGSNLERLLVEKMNMGSSLGGAVGRDVFGELMQPGKNGAASGLSKMLTGALGSKVGGALGSFIPFGGQILGSLVGKLFGGLFGESQGHKDLTAGNKQIDDLKTSLEGIYGSTSKAQAAAKMLGIDLAGAWGDQNLKGAEHFKGLMDELAQKQAKFNDDIGGTLGKIKDLGGNVPEALRPYLDQLKDAKVLTQDNIDLIATMTGQNTVDFHAMEEAANRYGISIDSLGQAFEENRMHEGWQQIIDDMDLLQRGGADMNAVLDGMQDEIQTLVLQSIQFGTTIPDNMRPWIQKLIDSGKLLGANGEAIKDINDLHFGDTMQTTLQKLNDTLQSLVDALNVTLPDAIRKTGRTWRDELGNLPMPGAPGSGSGGGGGGKTDTGGDGSGSTSPSSLKAPMRIELNGRALWEGMLDVAHSNGMV
jgi:hypothetical protein